MIIVFNQVQFGQVYKGPECESCRQIDFFRKPALGAKKVSLRKTGKGKKFNAAQAVTQKEEILMWKKGQMGDK